MSKNTLLRIVAGVLLSPVWMVPFILVFLACFLVFSLRFVITGRWIDNE